MTTRRTRPGGGGRPPLPIGPTALLIGDGEELAVLEPILKAASMTVVRRQSDRDDEFDLEAFLVDLEDSFDGPLARTTLAVVAADLLVDARLDIINLVDQLLNPSNPLLVSCTQATATEQAVLCEHPQRIVGFSILGLFAGHQVVEIAPALRSDPDLTQRVAALLAGGGATVQQVGDMPGLVLARILAPLVNEAALALGEGIGTAQDIDTAMRLGGNYPFGPLHWADEVGLHRILMVMEHLARSLAADRYRPAPLLRQLALSGFTGKGAGRGFFTYQDQQQAGDRGAPI